MSKVHTTRQQDGQLGVGYLWDSLSSPATWNSSLRGDLLFLALTAGPFDLAPRDEGLSAAVLPPPHGAPVTSPGWWPGRAVGSPRGRAGRRRTFFRLISREAEQQLPKECSLQVRQYSPHWRILYSCESLGIFVASIISVTVLVGKTGPLTTVQAFNMSLSS